MQPHLVSKRPLKGLLSLLLACVILASSAGTSLAAEPSRKATATSATKTHHKAVSHRPVHKKPLVKKRVVAQIKTHQRGRVHVVLPSRRSRVVAHARPQRQLEPVIRRVAVDERLAKPDVAYSDDPIALRSGSALVIDAQTNQVLLSKNANDVRPIASLTKLMTAAVILDAHLPMNQIIEITDADIDTLKWSSSRLRPGMQLPREELLKLALMSSENRAAHALARTYPGGIDAFMLAMNRKAQLLGMTQTHYIDPTGLSPQNESTAHDLALLVKAVYAYPLIREFSTHEKSTVDVGNRELQYRNTDHLIFNRGWDILLQKTGYINEAGHCLVLNAVVQGRRVVVVLLDAWGKYSHFGDAERIRSWMENSGRTVLTRTDPLPADASVRLTRTSVNE
jgi:D-alanyl-D-alanine endopeptidase (penicillin-binding protein 7)